MSQGSGSPVNFLDPETCDDILKDLRREDGMVPDFESNPGSPPPTLEAEVACDRGTQTSPVPIQDQSTNVLMIRSEDCIKTVSHQSVQALPPQLVVEGSTQTLPAWTRDNVTKCHLAPLQKVRKCRK